MSSGRLVKWPKALLFATVLVLACTTVNAHMRSQSRSSWQLSDGGAAAVFVAPAYETTRLGVGEPFERLASVYADHLLQTVAVSRGGRVCSVGQASPLPAERGYVRVEVVVTCDLPGTMRVRIDSFFDRAPSHVHLADVRAHDGNARDFLFTDGSREHVFEAATDTRIGSVDGLGAALLRYVRLGAEHILAGADHLAFLAALLLLCNGFRSVVWMVTGFTIGHSLTLAAAVLGLVEPDPVAVEVLIGFTIAVAAVEGSVRDANSARRAALGCAGALLAMAMVSGFADWRIGLPGWCGLAVFACCHLLSRAERPLSLVANASLSAVFGLVHGFGFARVLVDMELPARRLAPALAGFNVGVELGQLAVVVGLWGCLLLARRTLADDARTNMAEHATAMLCGLGVFWMISRCMTG